jgi:hypothetical protein
MISQHLALVRTIAATATQPPRLRAHVVHRRGPIVARDWTVDARDDATRAAVALIAEYCPGPHVALAVGSAGDDYIVAIGCERDTADYLIGHLAAAIRAAERHDPPRLAEARELADLARDALLGTMKPLLAKWTAGSAFRAALAILANELARQEA